MKTLLAATAFTLTLGLSGPVLANFEDRGPTLDTYAATATTRQDLSHIPTVTNFNQKSHHAKMATSATSASSTDQPMVLGANCDRSPRIGFKEKYSGPSC